MDHPSPELVNAVDRARRERRSRQYIDGRVVDAEEAALRRAVVEARREFEDYPDHTSEVALAQAMLRLNRYLFRWRDE